MSASGAPNAAHRKAFAQLRRAALAYAEAIEEFPWGHSAFKVRRKTFVFLAADKEGLSMSAKLPSSRRSALTLPFASPTEYGLGKSGWVTARFSSSERVPVDILAEWIDESYRAIAPKKLASTLDAD
jgi:predicted DNA-binding protein (MmcQ/YjbR family)